MNGFSIDNLEEHKALYEFIVTSDFILHSSYCEGTFVKNSLTLVGDLKKFGKKLSRHAMVLNILPEELLKAIFSKEASHAFKTIKSYIETLDRSFAACYDQTGACFWQSGNLLLSYSHQSDSFEFKHLGLDNVKSFLVEDIDLMLDFLSSFFKSEEASYQSSVKNTDLTKLIESLYMKIPEEYKRAPESLYGRVESFSAVFRSLDGSLDIAKSHTLKFNGQIYSKNRQDLGLLAVGMYEYLSKIGVDMPEVA